jgi:hypothetical protein
VLWGVQVWTKGCLELAGEVPWGAPAGQGAEVSGWRAGRAGRRCPGALSRRSNGSRDGRWRRSNGVGGGAPTELRHAPPRRQAARQGSECWRRG